MLDPTTPKARIVAAAMRLAAEQPWDKIGMADIAAAAGFNLAEMRREVGSKGAILAAFMRQIDDSVLARAPRRAPDQAGRDALFDVIMTRFDVMTPYKPALKSIMAATPFEPSLIRPALASKAWMLHAAGTARDGLPGTARVFGLATVYASALRTWLDDDDPGMARTMANLDRRLRSGERSLTMLDEVCGVAQRMAGIFTGAWKPAAKKPAPTTETPAAPPA